MSTLNALELATKIIEIIEQENTRKGIEAVNANNFDPLKDIPTNDEQAEIAIKFGKDPLVGVSAYGLYQIYRKYDNATVIQAYERVLIAIINASGS